MNCKQCGIEFIPKHKLTKYCSMYCRSKHDRLKRPDKVRKAHNNWRKNNIEHVKEYSKNYFNNNWGKFMLSSIKHRCIKKGYAFDIEENDLQVPKTCPILNIPIVVGSDFKYNSPSVDRIDNSKGYVKDNIQVISFAANCMKLDMPIEVWEEFKIKKKWRR